MPGDAIRKDRNHVVLDGGSVPDTSIPQLKAKAELYDLSGLASSGMNKVKLCAVDAVFKNEGVVVEELNDFLEKHPFGPYDNLSEASRELQKLRKKGKTEKADMLKALLQQFAVSQGANANAFEQLPALLKLMRQRNEFAHPYDKAYLVREMEKGNPDLSSISDMLTLFVVADSRSSKNG
ncbi:hypothetical protein VOLCADRAFT_101128 [Volvox carteri f. nagariensis]|uniref:Uncharacterized protein n=1 Tax=Volvox carteri f. nagariensis TaxID=3068 RepID=D8ULU3_VOLCA|nr:uncharacterized protein VOLCADRAFT_101128 [Volvox carteri f. nagariensis]EFJ39304.1 hypothetical protein VOLCADRAFT_101128 [Volvox carteri f. nagariensis]|eukprot:XP_002959629.1 hypothetical protein VOLCADRAFT_101128 [Volvox carteri f. nagariensis]